MIDQLWNFVTSQLQNNQLSQAALLATGLSSGAMLLWNYARAVPVHIWKRIERKIRYSMTIEEETTLHRYMDLWIQTNIPTKLRKVEATLNESAVMLTHENDYVYVWRNLRRMTISKTKSRLEAAQSTYNMFNRTYHITGLFAKKQIMRLVEEVVEAGKLYDKTYAKRKEKPDVFICDEWGGWARTKSSGKTFDKLFLKQKQKIIDDIDKFQAREDIYKELGVPYKRGYLFYGAPGNGKSTLAYAIGHYLKYDIYLLDLSNMSSANFAKAMKNVPDYSVVVIEDIDSFYHKREPLKENKITFSTLINTLSGVGQKNNIVTVITTNNVDSLDPALMRDGRCDEKFELTNPDKELVEQFISMIYNKPLTLSDKYIPKAFSAVQGIVLKNLDNPENCVKELEKVSKKVVKKVVPIDTTNLSKDVVYHIKKHE